jgi:xylulokinase
MGYPSGPIEEMTALSQYLCSIDIGTSSVRAALFDVDSGQTTKMCQRRYGLMFLPGGFAEQQPKVIWDSLCEATKALFADGINPSTVRAVSISAQRCTFIGVDADYNAVTNFISWMDGRGRAYCDKIKTVVRTDVYNRITGMLPVPQPSINKIMWLKDNMPSLYKGIHHFTTMESYALAKLGAEDPPVSHSLGSYMGMMDACSFGWSQELVEKLNLDIAKLPRLASAGTQIGHVSKNGSEHSGLAEGTALVMGGGDLQCAGLGAGALDSSIAVLNMGTAAGLLMKVDKKAETHSNGLACPAYIIPYSLEMEGHAQASTCVYDWFTELFGDVERAVARRTGLSPYQLLNHEAELAPPGAGGLIFVPTFNGAGAPFWMPSMKGMLLGLSLKHERRHVVRAILEGISVEMSCILDVFINAGAKPRAIHAVGGGSKGDLWNQIHADVFGLPVLRPAIAEASIVGAAICAGVGSGVYADWTQGTLSLVKIAKTYEPRESTRETYTNTASLYRQVLRTMGETGLDVRVGSHVDELLGVKYE